ncbi:hypothetical protein BDN67DRAFT_973348 [Paxillus ammoniavirescens]|nr:hypothetical protein BDN67DRAFT_973348 [Paxillus ammoniavirescens]
MKLARGLPERSKLESWSNMSLIQWSTPARHARDRDLLMIPNEIYLIIFEHIAPTSTELSLEQILTLASLSRICRFFGNVCLPHISEYLEFSKSVPSRARLVYEQILYEQIAAKQPLALSLVQCVKGCRFEDLDPSQR